MQATYLSRFPFINLAQVRFIEWQYVKAKLSAGIIIFTFVCLQSCTSKEQPASKPSNPVVGTLRRIGQTATFELEIKNTSSQKVWVSLYYWLYEVRIFDGSGKKNSDLQGFQTYAPGNWPGPSPKDWVLLQPNKSTKMKLSAFERAGRITTLPPEAETADCAVTNELSAIAPPSGKVPTAFIDNTEKIFLK